MYLNTIEPQKGAKKAAKRVGRGIGSGLGKTAGRGHKGQKSRAGGFHKVGFEGGQMPLQRRLPKRGFKSLSQKFSAEVTLAQLARLPMSDINLVSLKEAKAVPALTKTVKVIATGEIDRALTLTGVRVTAKAAEAITAAGGKVNE